MNPLSAVESHIYGDNFFSLYYGSFMRQIFGIGDVVRKLRITKAKTGVIEFARRAGVNKTTLSKIENGSNFKEENLAKIALALGYTVPELYSFLAPNHDAVPAPAVNSNDPPVGVAPKRRSRYMR